MLPWSVIASAGWPSAAAAATTSATRAAPSSIEYSVCWCRWANDGDAHRADAYPLLRPCGGSLRPRTSYSDVIPTLTRRSTARGGRRGRARGSGREGTEVPEVAGGAAVAQR